LSGALAGRSAVVTGASRGIGLAVARALASEGARVVMLARGAKALEREAAGIGEAAVALQCDVTNPDDVQRATEVVQEELGGAPHILVNSAGVFDLDWLDKMEPEVFERAVATNLIAPFRLVRAFVPGMRERGAGHVVTLGSVADRSIYPQNGAYSATKFGARAMHEVLRAELHGTGIRATLISPAAVDTPLWDAHSPDSRPGFTPRALMLRAEEVAEAVRWSVTRPPEVNIDELRLSRS
jgi:NADP-dependent 3-hydroxy acid dehydrogenase YdfG